MPKKIMVIMICLLLVVFGSSALAAQELDAVNNDVVYRFKIAGDIDSGMTEYVGRAYSEALTANADYMLLELDTYGGYATAAVDIKNIIANSPIYTICYVNSKAISAGALIAQACDQIVMSPSATMGAAEPRLGDEKADEKIVSFFAAEIKSAAQQNGRDGLTAAAMVDSDIAIEGIIEKDKLLTLSAAQAVELKMADGIANTLNDVLVKYDLENAQIEKIDLTFQEAMSQFLTRPAVAGALLAIGISGLVLELFFAGFGIAGFIGIVALTLYFTGGLMAGYAGWIAVALFVLSLVLMALELFVIPGFGVAGVLGVISLVAAVIMVAPSFGVAMLQLGIALLVLIALVVISLKVGKTRRIWNKLILHTKEGTDEGYLSQPPDWNGYLGMIGVVLTPLRPSGAVDINGLRVDVVTEGSFIPVGQRIKVIKVDGSSVIVRAIGDDE